MKEIKETQSTGRSLKRKGDRRAFLAAAAGAAAGATAATLLPQSTKRAEAAPGEPLIIGQDNDGEDRGTRLHATNGAFEAHGGNGIGVLGITNALAPGGPEEFLPAGVLGSSLLPGPGKPWGEMTGVAGVSGTGTGVHGESESGSGVVGNSESGPGVEGHSEGMAGVSGTGRLIGVLGWTREGGTAGVAGYAPGEIPGVTAHTQAPGGPMPPDGGVALLVTGRARFATAGAGVVRARSSTAAVSNPAVRSDCHITVTFTGDPGGAAVAWVERRVAAGQQPGGGFVVHLSGRARWAVPFTYLIVEPGA